MWKLLAQSVVICCTHPELPECHISDKILCFYLIIAVLCVSGFWSLLCVFSGLTVLLRILSTKRHFRTPEFLCRRSVQKVPGNWRTPKQPHMIEAINKHLEKNSRDSQTMQNHNIQVHFLTRIQQFGQSYAPSRLNKLFGLAEWAPSRDTFHIGISTPENRGF